MNIQNAEISVEKYINDQEKKSLLRFITCGSVDDGKSTLIGRLLYESKLLFEDQITALEADSIKSGTQGDGIDFALLVDGLASEREQGITIDVAYRFFSTKARKFIVIDTPGHEQYTRNMATGASQAQLAILLIDARLGLSTQTKRHSYIIKSLGVNQVVVAVNKMDLVNYSQNHYNEIIAEYTEFAKKVGIKNFKAIPISALKGDNVIKKSTRMPWYKSKALMNYLDTVSFDNLQTSQPFRMHVQWVNRPNSDFRGFSGRITSGQIQVGDKVTALPSGYESRVTKIISMDADLEIALPNESITLCLADEIDLSRGDTLCSSVDTPKISDRFKANILWMSEDDMQPGQTYLMKIGTRITNATVMKPKYAIDINTLTHISAKTLKLNETGVCIINTDQKVVFEPYTVNKEMGNFILINRLTNSTVAMGIIEQDAKATSIELSTDKLSIDRDLRAGQKNQMPVTLWYTGLKWSGKTFIANALDRKLFANGNHSFIIDSNSTWKGLSDDLNYEDADRTENSRRVAQVCDMMNNAGLIVQTCFTSSFLSERRTAKKTIGEDNFIEIYVNTPLEVAEAQDMTGFYKKARRGEISNIAGIDLKYEPPLYPDIVLGSQTHSYEEAADIIFNELIKRGFIKKLSN